MVKKGIVYVLNFFVFLSIFSLSSLLIFSGTILNKQYVLESLKQSNYYEKTYYNIQDEFKNYIMQSGLEEEILENLYDREKIENDINQVLDSVYEAKEMNINTLDMRKTLDSRIKEVLNQNNRKPDAEEERAIQTFEDTIIEVYEKGITYAQNYVKQIGELYTKISTMLNKITIALAVSIMVLLGIIIIMYRNVRETLKTIGIAILGAGLLNIVLFLLVGDRMHHVLILNATFSESLIYIASSIMQTFLSVGIIMTIIGIISIIIGNVHRLERDNYNDKNKEKIEETKDKNK